MALGSDAGSPDRFGRLLRGLARSVVRTPDGGSISCGQLLLRAVQLLLADNCSAACSAGWMEPARGRGSAVPLIDNQVMTCRPWC